MTVCLHCGQEHAEGTGTTASDGTGPFCCTGCAAAFDLVRGLGLERYYERRSVDPGARPLRPDSDAPPTDYAPHAKRADERLELEDLRRATKVVARTLFDLLQ